MLPSDEAAFREFQTHRQMADALNSVADLRDLRDVRIALRHAGYEDATIDQHMHGALEIAQDRLSIKRWVDAMRDCACLTGFLGSLYLIFAPDHAFAMDGREIVAWTLFGLITFGAVGVLLLGIVAMLLFKEPEPGEDEVHGDTSGYDRTPGWRK